MIRDRIAAADGWIDFSEYMDLALYAPGLGYYSAGAEKFGAGGDFVTAPEISVLFGRCVARALAEILREIPSGVVLELGAGTGAMAADILGALERDGHPPDRYLILEVSADLRERQRRTLQERVPMQARRVEWLDTLPDPGIDGVILANEVLDALPVSRFTVGGDGLHRQGVAVSGQDFCWRRKPACERTRKRVDGIQVDLEAGFPVDYTSEYCPSLPAFISGLAGALNRGLIMLVDYGLPRRELYHRDRYRGTLMCHYRHHAHADPFLYPGLQDISAWVDFSAVAEAAGAAGLGVGGYTSQANFLLAGGVDEEFTAVLEKDSAQAGSRSHAELAGQLQMLMMPGQMGERFKVMGLSRGIETLPAGFAGRDFRHLL